MFSRTSQRFLSLSCKRPGLLKVGNRSGASLLSPCLAQTKRSFSAAVTADEVFDLMDTDKSGTIDRVEFDTAMDKMGFEDLMAINRGNLFDLIDSDSSGTIDRSEFNSAMDKMGPDQLAALAAKLPRGELSDRGEADEASIGKRFINTFHVTVSKIMPAGFGWQLFSGFAENMGFQSTDIGFFLMTGIGDGLFVCAGHTAYCALQNAVMGYEHNLKTQFHTGIFLGSAAVCSGGMWQPTVDLLTAAGCSFNQVLFGTFSMTTLYFYTGLRLGRLLYPSFLEIEEATYGNLKGDAALSVAIGGAGGLFVGTDVSFGAANWARPFLGVEDSTGMLAGCSLAGTSTGTGFLGIQTIQNIVVPKGNNWID